MFSNLRANSQIYILHKDPLPYIEIGSVISVSLPLPRFLVNNFMLPQEMVVDITAKVNDNNITLQKLPANLDVADLGTLNGSIIITTSREAMNVEVDALKQKSINVLNSIDFHKKVINDCDLLLLTLNPEFAQQKQQKQEIDTLKSLVNDIINSIKELTLAIKDNKKAE